MHDRLPAGFDERLRARLAQTSRPLAASERWQRRRVRWPHVGPAPDSSRRDAGADRRGNFRPRRRRHGPPPSAVPRLAASRRSRRLCSHVPTGRRDVSGRPGVTNLGGRCRARAGADAGRRRASMNGCTPRPPPRWSRAAKVSRGHPGPAIASPASEPRGQERERIAKREGNASGERVDGKRADGRRVDAEQGEHAGGERAASQRPGILPRRPRLTPHARPAMPAPPAVLPDRTIPPP